jgi:hypothetical protein
VGTHLLCCLVFEHDLTVVFVGSGCVLSFSWLISLDANFHTYYLLPFILRHLLLAVQRGSVRELCVAGLFAVFSAVGNIPYYPPLAFLLVFLFVQSLLLHDPRPRLRLASARADLVPLAFLVALGLAFASFFVVSFRDVLSLTPGRDPATGTVLRRSFLDHAGVSHVEPLLLAFLTGVHTHGDNTFYVGLAPLVLAGYALVRCGRQLLVSFAAILVFLVLLSLGGVVAEVAYRFPGMAYFRHISVVFGQVKFLVLVLGGFGLDHVLSARAARPAASAAPPPLYLAGRPLARRPLGFALLALGLVEAALSAANPAELWTYLLYPRASELSDDVLRVVGGRCAAYGVCLGLAPLLIRRLLGPEAAGRWLPGMLLFAYLADMASFRLVMASNWRLASDAEKVIARRVFVPREVRFQPTREPSGELEHRLPELRFLARHGPLLLTPYVHLYSVVGAEACAPRYRMDLLPMDLAELLFFRKVNLTPHPEAVARRARDRWLASAIGCGVPKLRLVGPGEIVRYAGTTRASVVASIDPDSRATLLLGAAPTAPAAAGRGDAKGTRAGSARLGTVSVTSFRSDHLRARVVVNGPDPAWLYYADTFHPGWRARVNGRSVDVLRANVAFKAVELLPGTSDVELEFHGGAGSTSLLALFVGSVAFIGWLAALGLRALVAAARGPPER